MPTKNDEIKINIGATVYIEEKGQKRRLATCSGTNETTVKGYEEVIKQIRDCIKKAASSRKRRK